MKLLLAPLVLLYCTVSLWGQGVLYFSNHLPGAVEAPVKRPNGSGAGAGVTADLVLVTSSGDVVPLYPRTTFRTSSSAAEYYVNPVVVSVPDQPPGSTVAIRMRAYTGDDFGRAELKGQSSDVMVMLGGGIAIPPNLVGLQGFTLASGVTAPTIGVQPQSQTVPAGANVVLSVQATGPGPLSYQWQYNGADLQGATSATLRFPLAQERHTGKYRVAIRNVAGTVRSDEAVLTVLVSPRIRAPLRDVEVTQGQDAVFTAEVAGSALTYRWQHNGAAIPNVTGASLKLNGVQGSAAGTYQLTISNGVGEESTSATLTVVGAPFVERHLPAGYSLGNKLVVTLQATPRSETLSYLIEDAFPTGWVIGAISDGGVYDAVNKKVKFGPIFATSPRTFTYEITPAQATPSEGRFAGLGVADGLPSRVTGDDVVQMMSFHPADMNPADERLTGVELSAYGAAWKQGAAWPQGPNPIPASYISRAGALWRGGELYRVDPSVAPAPPMWWVNAAELSNTGAGKQIALGHNADSKEQPVFSCSMPSKYVPGLTLAVTTVVVPPPGTTSYVVEEVVPTGWTVSNLTEEGTFDPASGKVRWGLFFDDTIRRLSFDMLAPTTSTEPIQLTGLASFDGQDVELEGDVNSVASGKLGRPERQGDKGVDLTVRGVSGRDYVIEVSTDLIEWTPVKTFHNLNGVLHFEDSEAQHLRQKFFRAVLLP